MISKLASLSLLLVTAHASIPALDGYKVVWSDDFNGAKGSTVEASNWNTITYNPAVGDNNNEVEIYSDYASNAHLSGDGQLYIVPIRSSGQTTSWTSARLESVGSWTPPAGKAMIYQAEILVPDFTNSPAKFQGLWPAFWTKGESFRSSKTPWPECGEWDIFEVIDKNSNENFATMHFTDANGNQRPGFQGGVFYQGGAYHTWALKVDRRNSDWTKQVITVYMDGTPFYHFTGADVGVEKQWQTLAHSPFYIILNVAIGGQGSYPGPTTDQTVDGFEASMRVKYVAVYEST